MTEQVINGITELSAEAGAWLTQSRPTMRRLFLKKRLLAEGETALDWRDAQDSEKQDFTPPENIGRTALTPLYETAGAAYNDDTGYYELNGLTDITEEQMREIYFECAGVTNGLDYEMSLAYKRGIRTTLKNWTNTGGFFLGIKINGCCMNCSKLEVFDPLRNGSIIYSSSIRYAFRFCSRLRTIVPTLRVSSANDELVETFRACAALETVKLQGLKKDVSFADSPKISLESLQYLVDNAENSSAITVTVHADVYAKLTDEGNEQWCAVNTAAQEKQISFAKVEN